MSKFPFEQVSNIYTAYENAMCVSSHDLAKSLLEIPIHELSPSTSLADIVAVIEVLALHGCSGHSAGIKIKEIITVINNEVFGVHDIGWKVFEKERKKVYVKWEKTHDIDKVVKYTSRLVRP